MWSFKWMCCSLQLAAFFWSGLSFIDTPTCHHWDVTFFSDVMWHSRHSCDVIDDVTWSWMKTFLVLLISYYWCGMTTKLQKSMQFDCIWVWHIKNTVFDAVKYMSKTITMFITRFTVKKWRFLKILHITFKMVLYRSKALASP